MNATQREQVRLCILRHLDAAAESSFPISTSMLRQFIASEGFRQLDEPGLRGELQYLEDKGLIAKSPKVISPENPHWRITAAGRDLYAQQQT